MTTTMKAAQISKAGGDFEIVEREIPKPCVGHFDHVALEGGCVYAS
jgi:hypothetical protein